MKTKNLGIVLIIIGAIMMVYTGFNYISTKNVVDIGDIKINKTENHPVQWSPILGAVLLVGGVVLVAANKK
jgi:drug/metabolite transporter (DMT)-like permease